MPNHKKENDLPVYCDFCGKKLPENNKMDLGFRRKYCSEQCRQTSSRRRTSARLGIPSRVIGDQHFHPLYIPGLD